jgi:quinol monooxygenase YgiN
MHIISVTFLAKPGKAEALRDLLVAHARDSLANEPGCRQFDVGVDPANPAKLMVYEVYADAAATEAHRASAHFQRNSPGIGELVASRERNDMVLQPGPTPKR